MVSHVAHHLVRRGIQAVHHHLTKEQYIEKLEHDAQLYENAGPEMEVNPKELLPVVLTAIVAGLIIWSIDYTIGQVMASLAMIESPSTIIESKPSPPYADEPDALLEKEPLMAVEPDTDVEVTVINHKPITAKIITTIKHLHRIGGFRARWRGLGVSIFYHFLHGILGHLIAAFLGFGVFAEALSHVLVTVGLARVHMAWTHKMIAYPTSKWWWQRLPARKDCKALLLPALVYAMAQQATILLPLGVAFALGLAGPHHGPFRAMDGVDKHGCHGMAMLALRFLAIPTTYVLVALAVLLPASVTLTRVEASLLPEGEETIVPFDKAAIMGDVDVSVRGGCRALFVQAWRSVDRSCRLRIIKLYAKMTLVQFTTMFVAANLVVVEIHVIGGERLALFMKSAAAQLKLAAIKAHEARVNAN